MTAAQTADPPLGCTGDEESVLRTLLPFLPDLGITRLADQTGLDNLGVPVVAAFRPNSRSISVHQGKGLTKAQAKISAIMESAECHFAENVDQPLRWAAVGELPDTVCVHRLPVEDWACPDESERTLWVEGDDLIAGRRKWVPFEMVHTDYTASRLSAGEAGYRATTSGLGAGLSLSRARTHALWELLERDAISTWRAAGGPAARDATPLDLDSVRDRRCRGLLLRLLDRRVRVGVWAVGSKVGCTAFQALLVPPDGGLAGIEAEMGAALHADPVQALLGALCEAAQSRVTRIAGARDDYEPASYGADARRDRLAQASLWMTFASRRAAIPFQEMSPITNDTLPHRMHSHLEALDRAGCTEAVWVDLSRPGLPISSGRFIIPGLEGPFGH